MRQSRSREARSGWRTSVAMLALLALLFLGFAAVHSWKLGRFRHRYLAFTAGPDKTLWVEVKGGRMRWATASGRLKAASWVQPVRARWDETEFPLLTLPMAASVSPAEQRTEVVFTDLPWCIEGKWKMLLCDAAGVRWTHTFATRSEPAGTPDRVPTGALPGSGQPGLRISGGANTYVNPPAIEVELSPQLGGTRVNLPTAGAEFVVPSMRLFDSAGRELHVQTSYDPQIMHWRARVPGSGSYTVQASIDGGPLLGHLEARTKVQVP